MNVKKFIRFFFVRGACWDSKEINGESVYTIATVDCKCN